MYFDGGSGGLSVPVWHRNGLMPVLVRGQQVGPGNETYIIAEISGNHGGKVDTAKKLIDAAHWAGADAVKMQLFTPDSMTLNSSNPEFLVEMGVWAGRRLWDIYAETAASPDWFGPLQEHAESLGLHFFSSVFDSWGLSFLRELGVPALKIASNELTHWPLLEEVAEAGLPIFISTGGATLEEIRSSLQFLANRTREGVLPFYCVSAYPAKAEMLNLASIRELESEVGGPVGFSDHCVGSLSASLAVAAGAVALEKHIRLDEDTSSPDASFSASPEIFRAYVLAAREARKMLGHVKFGLDASEQNAPILRRRYFSTRDIAAGELIRESDLTAIRARNGLPTSRYKEIIGGVAKNPIHQHSPVTENDVTLRKHQ